MNRLTFHLLLGLIMIVALCGAARRVRRMTAMPAYGTMVKKMQKESMGMPDPKVGEMVAKMGAVEGGHPEEMGTYMEGDMFLPMDRGDIHPDKKFQFRWTDGVVPYTIDGTFDGKQRATIQRAIDQFHENTCIRFVPYTGLQKDFVSIENRQFGCFSAIGRTGGKQVVNLQTPGCTYEMGTTIHELMHALGIFHEQSRSDRDRFVNIIWGNIERGKDHNFKVHKYQGLGQVYDYGSVMHYSVNAFSKNRQDTIVPRQRTLSNIGQRKGFSQADIGKISFLYDCQDIPKKSPVRLTPPPFHPTPPPFVPTFSPVPNFVTWRPPPKEWPFKPNWISKEKEWPRQVVPSEPSRNSIIPYSQRKLWGKSGSGFKRENQTGFFNKFWNLFGSDEPKQDPGNNSTQSS